MFEIQRVVVAFALGAVALGGAPRARADGASGDYGIDYPSVAAARAAIEAEASSQVQAGWLTATTVEHGNPVLWSFTPEGHPAHPAVVKRTALELDGRGVIELATLCEGSALECERLLDDFRQVSQRLVDSRRARQIELDVGISMNDHDRVHVRRLLAEDGKAAEIRMDNVVKAVIVPSWDGQGVQLWTALYGFDGTDFRLLGAPSVAVPGAGTAVIDVAADSGDRYQFAIKPLVVERRETEREPLPN